MSAFTPELSRPEVSETEFETSGLPLGSIATAEVLSTFDFTPESLANSLPDIDSESRMFNSNI